MSLSETAQAPDDQIDHVPLSATQEFLRMFDQGDEIGPFSSHYNLVMGWRVRGNLDLATLQNAFDDVVARHDSLRATIVRGEDTGYQEISPPMGAQVTVVDITGDGAEGRDRVAEEWLGDLEAAPYSVQELPHLRGVLGRFDDDDAVLALIAHHTASDGWSLQLIMRDIATMSVVCGAW